MTAQRRLPNAPATASAMGVHARMSQILSIHVSDDLIEQLEQLALATDQSPAVLVEQAIARYVAEETWQLSAIREARDDYEAGTADLVPHEEVIRHMQALLVTSS